MNENNKTLTDTTKPGLPDRIYCMTPSVPCSCPPGTCENAGITLITCPKCGSTGAAFVCDEPGCPVNGGAAHG